MNTPIISLDRPNNPPATVSKSKEAPTKSPDAAKPRVQAAGESAPVPPAYEKIVTIGARIPASLHQSIKLFCVANETEMQQFVQDALTNHLRKLQGQ